MNETTETTETIERFTTEYSNRNDRPEWATPGASYIYRDADTGIDMIVYYHPNSF